MLHHSPRAVSERSRRRAVGLAAGACSEALERRVLLAVSASLSLSGTQTITSGNTINVSTDGAFGQSEMSIAVNPTNPLNVVGFSHRLTTPIGVEVYWSTNGGNTWSTTAITAALDGFPAGTRFDPSVAFDAGGNAYIAYGLRETAPSQARLVVARSTNGGQTWGQFRQLDLRNNIGSLPGVDKWMMATGFEPQNGGQAIYVAYTQNVTEAAGTDQRIVVTGSRDGGNTWLTPVIINDGSISGTDSSNLFAHPAVGPNGELYVSWHDINAELVRFDRDLSGMWQGGTAFGADITVRTGANLFGTLVPAQPQRGIFTGPVLTVDKSGGPNNGRLYLALCETFSGSATDKDILVGRSTNNGTSWTFQTVDFSSGTEFLPWVDVDQTSGSVNVIYYTTDGDQGGGNDDVRPRLATSTDGGVTWTRSNLSTQTSNEALGYGGDYLEYIGLDVHDGTAHGLWASRYPGGGTDLDAFTARASFNNAGTTNTLIINGDGAADTITIRRAAANTDFLEVIGNGVRVFTGLLASIDVIDVNPGAGVDTVIVDFVNGNPVPAGGLDGTNIGSADTLQINGSNSNESGGLNAAGTLLSWAGAQISFSDFLLALVVNGNGGNDSIQMEGLQAPLTFNGGAGDDQLVIGFATGTLSNVADEITFAGGTGNNQMFLFDDAAGAGASYVLTSSTFDRSSFPLLTYSAVSAIELTTTAGADTIQVDSLLSTTTATVFGGGGNDVMQVGPPGGNAEPVNGALTFNGGAGSDSLIYNDDLNAINDTYTITASTVTRTANGLVTYSGVESVLVHAGSGNNVVEINSTASAAPVTVNGNAGNDRFFVATGDWDAQVLGNVSINGGPGEDQLRIDDTTDLGADNYTVTVGSTSKSSGGGTISYTGLEIYRLEANDAPNTITVNSTFNGDIGINANGGADTINVVGNFVDTFITVDGGSGLDTVTVNSDLIGVAGVQFTNDQTLALLNISAGGRVRVPAGGDKVLTTQELIITGTGWLDLFDNDMIVDYTGPSQLATVQALLTSGYAAGTWAGNGIRSTTAGAAGNTALGYAEATDIFSVFPAMFSGKSVDNSSILVKYTFYGDADLSGNVALPDFNRLAANFGASPRRWSHGDFDFNQAVTLLDFNRLAGTFGAGGLGPDGSAASRIGMSPTEYDHYRSQLDDDTQRDQSTDPRSVLA